MSSCGERVANAMHERLKCVRACSHNATVKRLNDQNEQRRTLVAYDLIFFFYCCFVQCLCRHRHLYNRTVWRSNAKTMASYLHSINCDCALQSTIREFRRIEKLFDLFFLAIAITLAFSLLAVILGRLFVANRNVCSGPVPRIGLFSSVCCDTARLEVFHPGCDGQRLPARTNLLKPICRNRSH